MALSLAQYQKLQALLQDPNNEFSDDKRAAAQAKLDEYDNTLAGAKFSDEAPLAPGESERVIGRHKGPLEGTDEQKQQGLFTTINPSLALLPQVLSTQPATTHPQGDEAAADEWLRGDLNNPNGTVIAYDLPASEVRKKLFENPSLYKSLGGGFSVPEKADDIMSIQSGDAVHQAFNDYYWRQTADAASKAGKTAYRYSHAPWVTDGKAGSLLQNLSTKLNNSFSPLHEMATAFVLGQDDMGYFGVNRAAQNAGLARGSQGFYENLPDTPLVASGTKNETVGGVHHAGQSQVETNDMLEDEHPTAHALGQVAATAPGAVEAIANKVGIGIQGLSAWNPANKLWGWYMGESADVAAKAAKTALKGALSAGYRGAAAGATEQGVREGVDAAANYAATGDTGTTPLESGERILASALGGGTLPALGGGIRGLGNQISEAVEWGPRYKQAPGRLKAHGVETELGKGHKAPPVVAEAGARGRAAGGMNALGVLANDLQEPLSTAARAPAPNGKAAPASPANSPKGARRAVMRAGRSRGQDPNIPLLQGVARRAGGQVPEQLRGALVASDLAQLENQGRFVRPGLTGLSALGTLIHPGAAALALGSVADKAILKSIYPAAQALEKIPAGSAAAMGRAAAARARDTIDHRDEERRKERDAKGAAGYEERAKAADAGKKKRRREPEEKKKRRREETASE